MNLQEAGDAPRILHSGSSSPTGALMTDGGYVSLESGFSETVQRELMERGISFNVVGAFGGYQAIAWDEQKGVILALQKREKMDKPRAIKHTSVNNRRRS